MNILRSDDKHYVTIDRLGSKNQDKMLQTGGVKIMHGIIMMISEKL